jgi:mannosyltransferase OCH1-like enzyme
MKNSSLPLIPKKLHFIWVGGPLPDDRLAHLATWKATNPSFEIVRWDESNIDLTVPSVRRAYDRKQWATVADIVRLGVIAQHGGIYLDTDFRLLKPLDKLLQYHCFYGFQQEKPSSDWIGNGAFGAAPNHWFIKQAYERVLAIKERPLGLTKPTSYGPKLITQMLRENGLDHYSARGLFVRDVFLLPTPVLTPFSWHEEFSEDLITEETLAAHFWAASWVANIPAPWRILRRARSRIGRLTGR